MGNCVSDTKEDKGMQGKNMKAVSANNDTIDDAAILAM